MHETTRPASALQHPIWVALSDYSIGPADADLTFADRLRRENGWSTDQTERVIAEYKRFCFLAMTAGHPVTPSDAVDQAWHLHLAYTRDYWERFCPDVLGGPLHHGPTAGGTAERHRYYTQYAETLKSYELAFGEAAPADLWPDAARRLIEDPKARRVHPRDGVVVSRKLLRYAFAAMLALTVIHLVLW